MDRRLHFCCVFLCTVWYQSVLPTADFLKTLCVCQGKRAPEKSADSVGAGRLGNALFCSSGSGRRFSFSGGIFANFSERSQIAENENYEENEII